MRKSNARISPAGMTLIELLISLSITSALLLGLAAAFHASMKAVAINDAFFKCTQAARVAMNQMIGELRRADAIEVDPYGKSVQIIRPVSELTPNEIYRQYSYDAAAKVLKLEIYHAGNSVPAKYELAEHVAACKFTAAKPAADAKSTAVTLVSITLTCKIGESSVTLTAAASPRRSIGN